VWVRNAAGFLTTAAKARAHTPSSHEIEDGIMRQVRGRRLNWGLAMGAVATLMATMAARAADPVTPAQVIGSFEGTFGVHPGQRRNHTKGTCAVGEFVGTPAAAALSRSALFAQSHILVVARFSVAGGNPNVPDSTPNARGMALEFRLPGGALQHMTMLNTPVFGAASPATFNDMLIAARPDPKTGRPDPAKLHEFFDSHPDAMAQSAFLTANDPPTAYTTSAYFGIHAFKFIDAKGTTHFVRWQFIPRDGEKRLTQAQMASAPRDFLERGLIERIARGPALWDMVVYVGEPGDPTNNPTLAWPETRRHFTAGTLTITQAMPQKGAECEKINFDPLIMADGISASDDPVLLFRSPSYALSFAKRLSGQ
jgi:catalase